MARLVSKKCPNCGAPIALSHGITDVACQYCGHLIHVEWTSARPPVAQRPPMTVYVKPPSSAAVVWVVVLATVVGIGTTLFLALGPVLSAVVTQTPLSGVVNSAGRTTTEFPARCGMNEPLQIVNVRFAGSGTLITTDVNCKLVIRDSSLKGDLIVDAKHLAEITVENSTLEGSQVAIETRTGGKLNISKGSVIKGKEAAIRAGINTAIRLDHAKVQGDEVGIAAATNVTVEGRASEITGQEYGLRAELNPKIQGRDLTLRGERAALEGNHNLELEMRGGALKGGETALRTRGSNAKLSLSKGAHIFARETAVKTESNLSLEMQDALIEGGEIGIDSGVNPKLHLDSKARVSGGRMGIRVGYNLELELRSATVESQGVAICGPYNAEIEGRGSRIHGGIAALRFNRRPRRLELGDSTVEGKRDFRSSGCTLPAVP